MSQELWVLIYAVILGLFQIILAACWPLTRPGYSDWNAGPRDKPFDLGPVAGRLRRAYKNFLETFAFFAVIVICLNFAAKSDGISIGGAWLYLVARIIYIPLYGWGVKGPRSVAFIASLIGMSMCLWTLLFR